MRLSNKRRLVQLLFQRGEATKQELLQAMQVSAPTFWSLLHELENAGLVRDGERLEAKNGRRPMTIRFCYDARTALGIEIFESYARLSLVDLRGTLLAHEQLPILPQQGDYGLLVAETPILAEAADEFLRRYHVDRATFLGAGISVHGYVHEGNWVRTGCVIPVEQITRHFSYPVVLDNVAMLSGFAEASLKQAENAIYLTIGNGVGGAVIIDGELFRGLRNHAGDLGHFTLVPNGKLCPTCGRKGCFGAYIGMYTILGNGCESLEQFVQRLDDGDSNTCACWAQYLRDLATGICTLDSIMNVDILIGGEMAWLLERYHEQLEAEIVRHNTEDNPIGGRLRFSRFGREIGSVGPALYVAFQYLEDVK